MSQRERCDRGEHLPLVNRAKYQAAGPFWKHYGDCPFCRNTLRIPLERERKQTQESASGACDAD